MEDGPAGIRMGGRGGIESGFERRHEAPDGRLVRPGHAHRRHGPGADLANDLFPHVVPLTGARQIQRLQGQAPRLQPVVVARHAIAIDG